MSSEGASFFWMHTLPRYYYDYYYYPKEVHDLKKWFMAWITTVTTASGHRNIEVSESQVLHGLATILRTQCTHSPRIQIGSIKGWHESARDLSDWIIFWFFFLKRGQIIWIWNWTLLVWWTVSCISMHECGQELAPQSW